MTQKKGLPVFIYIAGATLIAAVIRLFQYLVIFDFDTGFYIDGSETGALIFRFFLLALAIALLVLCIIGNIKKQTAFTIASDGLGEKTSLYLGAAYLAAAAFSLWEVVEVLALSDMIGEEPTALITIVSIAQAAVFALTGLLMMKNSVIPAITGGIQIALTLVFTARAIVLFSADLVIKSHSDNLIILLAYIFGALFSTSAARCYARLESKSSRPKEIFAAGLTFIFSGLHVLPKLLMYLFGGKAAADMQPLDKSVICLLLVSGGFLCTLFLTTQRKEIEYVVTEDEEKKEKKKKKNEEE